MKDKTYYTEVFNKKWDSCLEEAKKDIQENGGTDDILSYVATEIFEDTANSEEIVGYYITYHDDYALSAWVSNTKGISFTEQDKKVDRVLKDLYKEG